MSVSMAIDCTNGNLTCAIFDQDIIYLDHYEATAGDSAERLAPIIQDGLQHHHIKPENIDNIISVAGPGGFSGVRTGTSFVTGFAAVTGAKIHALSSLEALALSIADPEKGGLILCALNAKRASLYFQAFTVDFVSVTEPLLLQLSEIEETLKSISIDRPLYLAGHGADFLKPHLKGHDIITEIAATRASLFGPKARYISSEKPHMPIYLRAPDAAYPKKKFTL
ncbi:MAG: tRNA (adenosine(37)-N6)-threonylcarbamoyltransferase complex dimerization subunit type 1 TsaB [Pseudomonadota bacterium]